MRTSSIRPVSDVKAFDTLTSATRTNPRCCAANSQDPAGICLPAFQYNVSLRRGGRSAWHHNTCERDSEKQTVGPLVPPYIVYSPVSDVIVYSRSLTRARPAASCHCLRYTHPGQADPSRRSFQFCSDLSPILFLTYFTPWSQHAEASVFCSYSRVLIE